MDFNKMIQGMKEKEAEEPKQETKPAFVFPNDPTDPDLERSYGPNVKSVAYRGEDIAKAKEAGWSDDDIYEALEEQDYDPDEILDYMKNYDPKRFKDPKTNPARSVEAWKAQEDLEEDWTDDKFDQELFDNEYIYAGLNKERAAEIMAERLKAPKDKVRAFIEKNFDEHYWDE